jgi:uridine phosphorylase
MSSDANRPRTGDVLYHIHCKAGDLPPFTLLPGDPERVTTISSLWDSAEEVAYHREYRTARGLYQGVPVSSTSTGVGSPGLEICLHELREVGVETAIRVGTTGSITEKFDCGDLIISTASVRRDGTSDSYVEPGFPSFAQYEVVLALIEACQRLGYRYGLGVTCTVGSFYLGQGRPVIGGYWPSWAENVVHDLASAGVTNFDMETSALFVLSHLYGMRAGSILAVVANRVTNRFDEAGGVLRACRAASEAVKILSEWDALKKSEGAQYFYPSLLKQ